MKEFQHFVSQYTVKRQKEESFTSQHPDEQFLFYLVDQDEEIDWIMFEKNHPQHNYYLVLNGPIDYKWAEQFINKYSTH
ncbi:hypothetical protein ACLIA0_13695 [Bacillaceae bacterium W0354]